MNNSSKFIEETMNTIQINNLLLVIAFAFIFLTGGIGNLLVIYVFGFKKKLRHRITADWLILYLGVVDFLSSIFNPPLYIYFTITRHQQWHFGKLGCKVLPALGPIMSSISFGVLLIFAIDRYLAIVSPVKGSVLSWKSVTSAFVTDIVLSYFGYLHYILGLKVNSGINNNDICEAPEEIFSYSVANSILISFRIVFFVTVFTFTTVKIHLQLKKCQHTSFSRELQRKHRKGSKAILFVLIVMGAVFSLLVFPKEILHLAYSLSWLKDNNGISHTPMLLRISSWLKALHTANSCANVFIYSKMHKVYRKQIFQLFYHIFCKKEYLRQRYFIKLNVIQKPDRTFKFCKKVKESAFSK
ncbi:neuropeptides B/W receptor type 1 [Hydra vulgaris]|uniref:neuropeptides B/W receptor type 1 n=1 Tax=Hydra vulgaris TaxID=6087 RepID=UPI001F5E53DF|nr:neuropeptides B/W receptor type 1-like [Hydra vulgaris]